jgi:hypothetical protein
LISQAYFYDFYSRFVLFPQKDFSKKESAMFFRISTAIVIPLLIFHIASYAQQSDAAVVVYQSTLNGFLAAVGPVSGTDDFNVLGMKGKYRWTVKNPHIEIKPDHAQLIGDADVRVGPIAYGTMVTGDVMVYYNQELNRISVKVLRASFEVYTKIFGKKIHITDVDISKYYRPEFEFAGPQPMQPNVTVNLPNGTTKTIFITPVNQNLRLEENRIVVSSDLQFTDHQ